MTQARTWAAFDVHTSGVVAATLDRDSGQRREGGRVGLGQAVKDLAEERSRA